MTNFHDLVRQLCPSGVEFKELGSCLEENLGGGTPSKADSRYWGGDIPWASVGDLPDKRSEITATRSSITKTGLENSSSRVIPKGHVVVAVKISPGKMRIAGTDVAINQDLRGLKCFTFLSHKFLFYYFQTIQLVGNGTIVQGITKDYLESIKVPIPPIEVQDEIVRILDKFTQLEAELEDELEARRKQYEYYRNQLLSFPTLEQGAVLWVPMGDLGVFFGGLSGKTKSDFENGNSQYISYVNIAANIEVQLFRGDLVLVDSAENQNEIKFGDVLFTGSSETPHEVGLTSVVASKPESKIYLNSFCFGFRPHEGYELNVGFAKHLFRSEIMRAQIVRCANGVTRFNLSKAQLAKVLVPIPGVAEQKRIAEILDKLEKLTTSLSEGLPGEIKARRKQYEYYRDKLLTFDELDAA